MDDRDGVYFLSNPCEVQELMRDIEKKTYALTHAANTGSQTPQPAGPNDILLRIQALEEKMRNQEEYITKAVTAIAQEFTLLRDSIDERMAKQDTYKQGAMMRQNTEESWRREMEERCQHIAELVGNLDNSIRTQSSFALWFRQLFGCQPKP